MAVFFDSVELPENHSEHEINHTDAYGRHVTQQQFHKTICSLFLLLNKTRLYIFNKKSSNFGFSIFHKNFDYWLDLP